jgi:hypothetical protein
MRTGISCASFASFKSHGCHSPSFSSSSSISLSTSSTSSTSSTTSISFTSSITFAFTHHVDINSIANKAIIIPQITNNQLSLKVLNEFSLYSIG